MTTATLTSSQQEMLRGLPARVPIERIDRLWIFAAHMGKVRESGLFVLSLLPEEAGDAQRTLVTLRYQAEVVKNKLVRTEAMAEEGSAPVEQIERVISGVLARSQEESGELVAVTIEGQAERWAGLLERVGLEA